MPTTRSRKPRNKRADALSATFSALADPTRRAILARLAAGPATVQQLKEPFAISGPAISRHLRVLEDAGLVEQGREAQWRPRTLRAEPLRDVSQYAEKFREFWDASYRRLDSYLTQLKNREPDHAHEQEHGNEPQD